MKNPLPQEQASMESEESIADFRKQVYKNTQLNAKMTSKSEEAGGKKHSLPKDILSLKHQQEAEEQLQWNQRNLDENEITKQQFQDIHVDEPKTPYQGAVDPEGEYYKADDEEADLDNFSLGEAEYKMEKPELDLNANIKDGEQLQDEEQPEDLNAEERHKRFLELRKKHYKLNP